LQNKKENRMLVRRGYKYRILPSEEQGKLLLQCGGNARFLWNYALKVNQDYYKETGKFKTQKGILINADINGALNIVRKEVPLFTGELWNRGCAVHPMRATPA